MSIGSELLRLLINIAIVLIGGALLYELIVWAVRNIIKPLIFIGNQFDKIPPFLTTYSQAFSNSLEMGKQHLTLISNDTRIISSRIIATRESIPLYNLWSGLGLAPERHKCDEIIRSLNFLAAAIFETQPSEKTIEKIKNSLQCIENNLDIQKEKKQTTSKKTAKEEVPVG